MDGAADDQLISWIHSSCIYPDLLTNPDRNVTLTPPHQYCLRQSVIQGGMCPVCAGRAFLRWRRVWSESEPRRECLCPGSRSDPEHPGSPLQRPTDRRVVERKQTILIPFPLTGFNFLGIWSSRDGWEVSDKFFISRHTGPGSGWERWKPCFPSQQPARTNKQV